MEYLNLYDIDGNLLKEKGVRGINGNGYKGIALIFIENSKGEFLIQKTSKNRDSVYATTGGHVDYGDTFDHTIIKEVREELGIDISNDNIIKMGHFIWNHYYEQVYYLKKDIDIKDIKVLEDEVEFVKWISIEEIFELIKGKKFREGNINGLMDILSKYHKEYL